MIHQTAVIEEGAIIGEDVKIWQDAHVRSGAVIGDKVIIGRNVFIDAGVRVGRCCKIQNSAMLYQGTEVADGVFIGPGVVVTNDVHPRAVTPQGQLKTSDDWSLKGVVILEGASIGAGAVLLAGITVGRWAMIGAGAIVLEDVPPHTLVVGVPARAVNLVCYCGRSSSDRCRECGWSGN
jgi:UDP-2-acetamido-3-amino-2,3-dideoxy-glucuronate N-acetyltransferase